MLPSPSSSSAAGGGGGGGTGADTQCTRTWLQTVKRKCTLMRFNGIKTVLRGTISKQCLYC